MAAEEALTGDVYYPIPEFLGQAGRPQYDEVHAAASANLTKFWGKLAAQNFDWFQPWETVLDARNAPFYRWFAGARVNIVHNALDRHMRTVVRNKAALIFEGEPGDVHVYTYQQLNHEVTKLAAVLQAMGLSKGDRVLLYLGNIPETIVAMLTCARLGLVHTVTTASADIETVSGRLLSDGTKLVITADGAWYQGAQIPLKEQASAAIARADSVQALICVRRTGQPVTMASGTDYWYHDLMALPTAVSRPLTEMMNADDPLFRFHQEEGTEAARTIVHGHGGYMVGTATSLDWVFDLRGIDVWWCTADLASMQGHSYAVYAPLVQGATTFIYEGAATFPYPDRWWQLIAKHNITILYTTAAALQLSYSRGQGWLARHDLSSLRLLGLNSAQINVELWKWAHEHLGQGRCPIMHTWLQPETGSIVLAPFPHMPLKPGSVSKPLPGVQTAVVTAKGKEVAAGKTGTLVIQTAWPAMLQTVANDPDAYFDHYWRAYAEQGWYSTGLKAHCDENGYLWLTAPATP